MKVTEFKNSLLKSLDAEIIARLGLIAAVFEVEHEIELPAKEIERLFFVEEGMASMTTTFKEELTQKWPGRGYAMRHPLFALPSENLPLR